MVIILKNLELAPISINAIPMGELDGIQEWLTDCTLTYTAFCSAAKFDEYIPHGFISHGRPGKQAWLGRA